MGKKIMKFEEFVSFLESDESKHERIELKDFFTELRKKKQLVSAQEWSKVKDRRFIFLTYDLIDVTLYPNRYTPINNFLAHQLHFYRRINGRRLTNNSFVAYPIPLDQVILRQIGTRLVKFFSGHLPQFRIYLNISSESEYFLHS